MASGRAPRTLRDLRRDCALTQEQLAEDLVRYARDNGLGPVGVDAAMISKWERGVKGMTSRYRRLVAGFFGIEPDELVLGSKLRLVSSRRDADLETLSRTADGLVLATAPEAEPHLTVVRGFPTIEDLLEAVDATTENLTASYPWTPAHDLMGRVTGHLESVERTARRLNGAARSRAIAGVSETALLAGRLAVYDLGQPILARGYFIFALEAAREARDRPLAAAALGHASVIPARELRHDAATAALRDAQGCVSDRDPLVRAWLVGVESELLTRTGLPGAALQALERAERLLGEGDPGGAPRWLDVDANRLDGLRGFALMRLGRHDDACATLERALGRLPGHAPKQRAALLADLAAALSSLNLVERARAAASQARAILDVVPYVAAAERLRGLG